MTDEFVAARKMLGIGDHSIDRELRAIVEEDFVALVLKSAEVNPEVRALRLDLDGTAPFDIFLLCDEVGNTVTLGREIRLIFYRIAQANIFIGITDKPSVDKRNALARYIDTLARLYVQKFVRRDAGAMETSVPNVAEYFELSDEEAHSLEVDPRYQVEPIFGWRGPMRSLLAHEIAHFELGHCGPEREREALADREHAADVRGRELAIRAFDDPGAPPLAHVFCISFFHHDPNVSRNDFTALCIRSVDRLLPMLKDARYEARRNLDNNALVANRLGLNFAALTDTEIEAITAGERG